MAQRPSLGRENPTADGPDVHNPAEAVLALSGAATASTPSVPASGQSKLLGAVSTLLALTPRGRSDELARLSALAHGYIGIANDDELMALAKAVANRDDVGNGLADRLARASTRAAQTLIRANRLDQETIAHLLETGDEDMKALIARHHTLHAKHITVLVAQGNAQVLKALLENRQSDFTRETAKMVEHSVAGLSAANAKDHQQAAHLTPKSKAHGNPQRSAQSFADMDSAGRRAVLRRLAEDAPKELSFSGARQALDPTRNDADLQFLTVIEQRDQQALARAFAEALDLSTATAAKLLDEADGDALIVLAKAAGLSSTAFARMLILGKVGMTGSPRDTFALVDRFNALPIATADLIVRAIRGEGHGNKTNAQLNNQRTINSVHTARQVPTQAPSQAPTSIQSPPKPRSILSLANGPQGFRKAV
jgi:hypothetical protein